MPDLDLDAMERRALAEIKAAAQANAMAPGRIAVSPVVVLPASDVIALVAHVRELEAERDARVRHDSLVHRPAGPGEQVEFVHIGNFCGRVVLRDERLLSVEWTPVPDQE